MESTVFRKYSRLAHETKQKYGLFSKLLLTVVGACVVSINPHIFLTRANQLIKDINSHFDGTLNNFGTMVFA